MTFPVTLHVFGLHLHPHMVLELAAYITGSQLFLWQRRRAMQQGRLPILPAEDAAWIFVGLLFGTACGALGLAALEHVSDPNLHDVAPAHTWLAWLRGKTIVGGLLGGWAGLEGVKRLRGVRFSTGDLFVLPLAVGIAIGRIGCFLTGLEDGTYGVDTTLPWAVDFGDGIARHPTQLYESLVALALGLALWLRRRHEPARGLAFREFLGGYLTFRFGVEFIKPVSALALGLSAIQWAALAGALGCFVSWRRLAHTTLRPA